MSPSTSGIILLIAMCAIFQIVSMIKCYIIIKKIRKFNNDVRFFHAYIPVWNMFYYLLCVDYLESAKRFKQKEEKNV